MNRRLIVAAVLAAGLRICDIALAEPQHGTAENGYYPPGYTGDTFTGVVTSTDDASRSITLTYTNPKNGKKETLVGLIPEGYTARWKDATLHEVKPSDIPTGTRLKVYYMTTERKVEGKKVKSVTIFQIAGVPNVKAQYSTSQPH